jgi:hypothetical protein
LARQLTLIWNVPIVGMNGKKPFMRNASETLLIAILSVLGVKMNEHKTAIARTSPSAPMKWLAANDRIVGRALDWGCGRGYDAETYGMESYDPHYKPVLPGGAFVQYKLTDTGKAYITVRNDKRALRGTTSKGTYQCHVILRLPVVRSTAGFVTYVMDRNDGISEALLGARTYE